MSSAISNIQQTELLICELGSDAGWFLPVSDEEQKGEKGVRALCYAIVMIWAFLGVSIIADTFVVSIEAIANKKIQKIVNGRAVTVKVWNDVVATLSLMALGSSAPEIFFSVIELFRKDFKFGALGPSTIVGSAAFNLLVIVGVCIMTIPSDEIRVIKDLPAFYVTAMFSISAYVWVGLVLTHISKNVIEVWEAVVTLLLMPVLIYVSYMVDTGQCDCILQKLNLLPQKTNRQSATQLATIAFSEDMMMVPGTPDSQTVKLTVKLSEAMPNVITTTYRTEAFTAVPSYDYEEIEGENELTFADGETSATLDITILPKPEWRAKCKFFVILEGLTGPGQFNPNDDGGEDSAILTVTIKPINSKWSRIDSLINIQGLRMAANDWKEKLPEAVFVNGSREEQMEASFFDWLFHCLTIPWKLAFLIVPPPSLFGAWPQFLCCIFFIALISAVLSDLAEMFGCVLSVADTVTSITFVALGTSVPDLFASLSAARADPTADASVVNVTGSNSVNVFLGLGVTWTIGAIYWRSKGKDFVCESSDLGFSIIILCSTCCCAFLLIYLRRKVIGGELGGDFKVKLASFATFLSLWFFFIGTVSWRSQRKEESSTGEDVAVMIGAIGTILAIMMWPLTLLYLDWRQQQWDNMCCENMVDKDIIPELEAEQDPIYLSEEKKEISCMPEEGKWNGADGDQKNRKSSMKSVKSQPLVRGMIRRKSIAQRRSRSSEKERENEGDVKVALSRANSNKSVESKPSQDPSQVSSNSDDVPTLEWV